MDALVGAGTLAGTRHDFAEQLRLGTRRGGGTGAGPSADRDRRCADRARPLPRGGSNDPASGGPQAQPARRTRASPTTASCTATSTARSPRCGTRSRPAAARRAPHTCETLLGDLELMRGRIGAAHDAYRERSPRRHPASPRPARDSRGSTRRAGGLRRAAARLRALDEPAPADHRAHAAGRGGGPVGDARPRAPILPPRGCSVACSGARARCPMPRPCCSRQITARPRARSRWAGACGGSRRASAQPTRSAGRSRARRGRPPGSCGRGARCAQVRRSDVPAARGRSRRSARASVARRSAI